MAHVEIPDEVEYLKGKSIEMNQLAHKYKAENATLRKGLEEMHKAVSERMTEHVWSFKIINESDGTNRNPMECPDYRVFKKVTDKIDKLLAS